MKPQSKASRDAPPPIQAKKRITSLPSDPSIAVRQGRSAARLDRVPILPSSRGNGHRSVLPCTAAAPALVAAGTFREDSNRSCPSSHRLASLYCGQAVRRGPISSTTRADGAGYDRSQAGFVRMRSIRIGSVGAARRDGLRRFTANCSSTRRRWNGPASSEVARRERSRSNQCQVACRPRRCRICWARLALPPSGPQDGP